MERDTEERGTADQRSIARGQPIDACRGRGLDRLRERLVVPRRRCCGEVAQVLRVPTRALRQRLEQRRPDRRRLRGRQRQLARASCGGQRSGRELLDGGELEPCQEPTPAVLPHHAAQPGPAVDLRADVVEEGARGLVHPVGVVEDQERGAVEHHLQEPRHDLERLRAAVLGAQRQHLGRVREVHLERRGEQRDPRYAVTGRARRRGGRSLPRPRGRGRPS